MQLRRVVLCKKEPLDVAVNTLIILNYLCYKNGEVLEHLIVLAHG